MACVPSTLQRQPNQKGWYKSVDSDFGYERRRCENHLEAVDRVIEKTTREAGNILIC